ncbi:MAG: CRTAC1 family protein [Myxococcota bacterium]
MVLAGVLACASPAADEAVVGGPGTLEQGGVRSCADPTDDRRLSRADLGEDWATARPVGWPHEDYWYADGLAVDDLTGDGHLDVLVTDYSAIRFYVADGEGGWREESAARFPPAEGPDEPAFLGYVSASPADVDGDGDLDVVATNGWYPSQLFINDGDGYFTDATATAGFGDVFRKVRSAPAGDIDGDGDLDLFFAAERHDQLPPEPGDPSSLYENLGDGTFRDVSDRLSYEAIHAYTKIGAFVDGDLDGDADLYLVNDRPEMGGNYLLCNDGAGGFSHHVDAGADIIISGMGLAVADLNEDGVPDLAVAGWGEIALLETYGPATWGNAALARGLLPEDPQIVAWGLDFADFDNDGRADLVGAFGPASADEAHGENPEIQPDALWLQQADGTFREVGAEWGVDDEGNGRAVAAVDIDDDGWVDLVTHGHAEAGAFFRASCGREAWVKVRVRGRPPNTRAIGARVRVWADGVAHGRWITASSGLSTHLPPEAHFGLGDAEVIDRVEVVWPDGEVSVWEDVAPRQVLTAWQEGS